MSHYCFHLVPLFLFNFYLVSLIQHHNNFCNYLNNDFNRKRIFDGQFHLILWLQPSLLQKKKKERRRKLREKASRIFWRRPWPISSWCVIAPVWWFFEILLIAIRILRKTFNAISPSHKALAAMFSLARMLTALVALTITLHTITYFTPLKLKTNPAISNSATPLLEDGTVAATIGSKTNRFNVFVFGSNRPQQNPFNQIFRTFQDEIFCGMLQTIFTVICIMWRLIILVKQIRADARVLYEELRWRTGRDDGSQRLLADHNFICLSLWKTFYVNMDATYAGGPHLSLRKIFYVTKEDI